MSRVALLRDPTGEPRLRYREAQLLLTLRRKAQAVKFPLAGIARDRRVKTVCEKSGQPHGEELLELLSRKLSFKVSLRRKNPGGVGFNRLPRELQGAYKVVGHSRRRALYGGARRRVGDGRRFAL